MPDERKPIDERRHAELVQKYVYGDPQRRKGGKAMWFKHTSSSSLGIEIAVAIGGCTMLGLWLQNNYTHWAPWTMIIGLFIGLGAATKALIRTSQEYERGIEREREYEAKQARLEDAETEPKSD